MENENLEYIYLENDDPRLVTMTNLSTVAIALTKHAKNITMVQLRGHESGIAPDFKLSFHPFPDNEEGASGGVFGKPYTEGLEDFTSEGIVYWVDGYLNDNDPILPEDYPQVGEYEKIHAMLVGGNKDDMYQEFIIFGICPVN